MIIGSNQDVDSGASELLIPTGHANRGKVLTKGVLRVKADPGNSTNVIYVGQDSTVSATTGYPLTASQEMVLDGLDTADNVWVIASADNQKVAYCGL